MESSGTLEERFERVFNQIRQLDDKQKATLKIGIKHAFEDILASIEEGAMKEGLMETIESRIDEFILSPSEKSLDKMLLLGRHGDIRDKSYKPEWESFNTALDRIEHILGGI